MSAVSRETAAHRWPSALPLLDRYAEWLAGAGVERGLIGPREAERLWERHLINSAALGEFTPEGVRVLDVGSGAGLPGIPLAITRPDLKVILLEPLARRVDFLNEVVTELGLSDRVQVLRGRAEEIKSPLAEVVTARAVAALAKLVPWCWPLTVEDGQLLFLKGEQAEAEIEAASRLLAKQKLKAEVLVGAEAEIRAVRVTSQGWQTSPRKGQ